MSLPGLIVGRNRQRVAQCAQRLLDGQIGVVEAAHRIGAFSEEDLAVDQFDPDFFTFVLIRSETDALPVGDVRRHWAPDALVKKDAGMHRPMRFIATML
jgi:hypothetical protein